MNPQKFFTGRAVGLIAVVIIVLAFFGFKALNSHIYSEKQDDGVVVPYRATLSGEYLCLPHTEVSGVNTKECALGLKTEAGEYYAIDFNLMSQEHIVLNTGDQITATGLVTPVEMLSSDYWKIYPIEGIFSVTDSVSAGGKHVAIAKINQTITIGGVTLTPLEALDDSRCPVDVTCVWAGTVKVRTRVVTESKTSEITFELGSSVETGAGILKLEKVSPDKYASTDTIPLDYQFYFSLTSGTETKNN